MFKAVVVGLPCLWLLYTITTLLLRRHRGRTFRSAFTNHYPHRDPLLGTDLLFQTYRDFKNGQLAEGMRLRHARYGDTFLANELGACVVYTIDPDNIRAVTTAQFADFGKAAWTREAAKHVGAGILLNEGEQWKASRGMLRPVFARSADLGEVLEPRVRELMHVVSGYGGREFEFQDVAARFMLDAVSDFLFGSSTGCLDPRVDSSEPERFLACIKAFEEPSGMFMAVGVLAWLKLLPAYRRLITVVNGMKTFFRKQLGYIMASSADTRTSASSASCFRMMREAGVPVPQIEAELKNIFFASFDTSTALLSNLVGVLATEPAVQERLRREIAEQLGDRPPARTELARMKYLRFVVLEALRLYSPVASHSRLALETTTLPHGGGPLGMEPVTIPRNTTVIWSTYALNRSPRYYGADWAVFRPERWEELEEKREYGHFFMPFGSGPRSCMGQQMAQGQLAYVIVRLLQSFSVLEGRRTDEKRGFREARAVSFYDGEGTVVSMRI